MNLLTIIKNLLKQKQYGYYRSMSNDRPFTFTDFTIQRSASNLIINDSKKVDERKNQKPIEVWNELISEIPTIDCINIDCKIKQVKKRISVLKDVLGNENPTEEYEVLGYLKARKKYKDFKEKLLYPITTDSLIKKLCQEYKLIVAPVNQYYTTMPKEAIDELAKYLEIVKKIRKEDPEVKLIVPDAPETKAKKKDPILLVASPFGRWYYIIGAWDREVLIIDDIIYNGK